MQTTKFSLCLGTVLLALVTGINVSAQTEKILHTFGASGDGDAPWGGLVLDGKGNLYGTTSFGGPEAGTVFELTPNANGTWAEKLLYVFPVPGPGFPFGGLAFDAKGNLYGTTLISPGSEGNGAVFELSPNSNGGWTEEVVYNFNDTADNDGYNPYSGVTIDTSGNLYGTTDIGGTKGFGTAFELVANSDGTWAEKILHNFTGKDDGAYPYGGLILDGSGGLYGIAQLGGIDDYGVVYHLVPGDGGTWTEHIVHSFTGGSGGIGTLGSLAMDKFGNLYVAAVYAILELTPTSGGTWTTRNIHSFVGGNDGASAESGLTFDGAGNLYGTTYSGGMHMGAVFKLSAGVNGVWTEKILHSFVGGSDGRWPQFSNLTIDQNGNVFGTTQFGGSANEGIVFEITP